MFYDCNNRIYSNLDYYAILEIAPNATPAEIKKNYIRLAKSLHPDKIGHIATEDDNDRFRAVQTAFEILRDPENRKSYDQNRNSQAQNTIHNSRTSSADVRQAQNNHANPIPNISSNILLMAKISQAALSKNIERLKQLLEEYKQLNSEQIYTAINAKEFNWLLRTAAFDNSNEAAKILLQFGADPNHYGPIIRKDNSDILECYFVEMLIYHGNKQLFIDLQDLFDFSNFVVSLDPHDNITNPRVNLNNLSYAQFNEYERNLTKEQDKAAARIFLINLNTRLFMLSMMCHWVLENGYPDVLKKIKDASQPKERWSQHSQAYNMVDHAFMEDRVRSCMLFHRYNSLYLIDKFESTQNQSRANLFKYHFQYYIDRLCLNSTLLLSKDSNVKYLEDIVKRFSLLLEADKIDAINLIHRLEWQKRHHYKFMGLFYGSFMLGVILPLVSLCLHKDNEAKTSLAIASLSFIAPFLGVGLLPLVLLLLRPLSCGLYDVFLTLDEVILSAYTNLLLTDILNKSTALREQPTPEPAQESCLKNTGCLFFCYGVNQADERQTRERDPESPTLYLRLTG